jgi:hypothetical protein
VARRPSSCSRAPPHWRTLEGDGCDAGRGNEMKASMARRVARIARNSEAGGDAGLRGRLELDNAVLK